MLTAGPLSSETVAPDAESARPRAAGRSHRDLWASLLLALACLLVYNSNLRLISAGDTYPARYLPFGIWRYHTVLLDPIRTITAQQRDDAFWIVRGRGGHSVSTYPIVVPVLIAPLYLPAVVYLDERGWDQLRLERVARVMEKLSASLLAATAVALLFLLLRRRAGFAAALLLSIAFAFGTTTWVISSQALWQHGLGELLIVAELLLLTGPCTIPSTLAAGLLCGLIACNRPPDTILAAAFGICGLWWARRLAPLLAAAALPVGLVLVYNLGVVGNVAGGYGIAGDASFFQHDLLPGLAGLLFSPARGLFVFSPFLLFLPCCLPQALRDRGNRNLTIALGTASILLLLLYAKADWRQGFAWGPRWLTDLLPVMLWMLAAVFNSLRPVGRAAFIVSCGAAIAIQTVGAYWYTHKSDYAIYTVTAGSNPMRAAWDPRNTPFIAELRTPSNGPDAGLAGFVDGETTRHTEMRGGVAWEEVGVTGWALASGHSPREVIVLLDGRPAASTTRFFARPDVASILGTTDPSGWRVSSPTRDLPPGEHVRAALVRANDGDNPRPVAERRFLLLAAPLGGVPPAAPDQSAPRGASQDLALSARLAAAFLATHQQAPGYWLTSYTDGSSFQHPRPEMNTFLTSVMIDVLSPVAAETGLADSLRRARSHLAQQIESGGLVRYHGRPDAPTIGTLGCVITPDADNTALVWRIAPGAHPEQLPAALATLNRYRTAEGLYRTWLAPPDRYQCIDPGKDPNPADVGIQMHVLMLLAKADPPAAHALCRALTGAIAGDRIWVYYRAAPLIPILRQADLQRAGCALRLPPSRLQTAVPGQADWIAAGQMLQRIVGAAGRPPASTEVVDLLRRLSRNDFAVMRAAPPLLYHNDVTASVPRFYWSEDFGYALWLRLYFESLRHGAVPAGAKEEHAARG